MNFCPYYYCSVQMKLICFIEGYFSAVEEYKGEYEVKRFHHSHHKGKQTTSSRYTDICITKIFTI